MKKYAVLHEPGDIVTLAGTRFVVLDVERRGSLPDSLFLLALESVGASEFGNSNNYAESDLKKAVDKWWLKDMGKRGLDNAKLIPREIDLTTLDGSGCYGKLSVMAAPLTLDEARKYADIIPNAERWCWLATGWCGPRNSDGDYALCVGSGGGWHVNSCSISYGIRPALKAPSILFEDSEAGLDLSKIPTDDLLQEIHRRLAEKA